MKALLIDDERLARNELRRLLAAFPQVVIAGEAANAKLAREQLAMAQGTQILCKNPDGSQSWYTIDAERSSATDVVLKAV